MTNEEKALVEEIHSAVHNLNTLIERAAREDQIRVDLDSRAQMKVGCARHDRLFIRTYKELMPGRREPQAGEEPAASEGQGGTQT